MYQRYRGTVQLYAPCGLVQTHFCKKVRLLISTQWGYIIMANCKGDFKTSYVATVLSYYCVA